MLQFSIFFVFTKNQAVRKAVIRAKRRNPPNITRRYTGDYFFVPHRNDVHLVLFGQLPYGQKKIPFRGFFYFNIELIYFFIPAISSSISVVNDFGLSRG